MSYQRLAPISQSEFVTERSITQAIQEHGVTPGGLAMMKAESQASQESIATGLYVVWAPDPSCVLTSAAHDGVKDGTSQCCRVGSASICMCGHSLSTHKVVKVPKRPGCIKPPKCDRCGCGGFSYCPFRPEECGQWWLPRRKDFDIESWRERVRQKPHEYACIGCEQKVSNHETVFESREGRLQRGAAVDDAYMPLHGNAELTDLVLGERVRVGGRKRIPAGGQHAEPLGHAGNISLMTSIPSVGALPIDTNESAHTPRMRARQPLAESNGTRAQTYPRLLLSSPSDEKSGSLSQRGSSAPRGGRRGGGAATSPSEVASPPPLGPDTHSTRLGGATSRAHSTGRRSDVRGGMMGLQVDGEERREGRNTPRISGAGRGLTGGAQVQGHRPVRSEVVDEQTSGSSFGVGTDLLGSAGSGQSTTTNFSSSSSSSRPMMGSASNMGRRGGDDIVVILPRPRASLSSPRQR